MSSLGGFSKAEFLMDRDQRVAPTHIHDNFNVDLVQAGVLEYTFENRTFIAQPGTLVWISRNQTHSARSLSPDFVRIRSFFMSELHHAEHMISPVPELEQPLIFDRVMASEFHTVYDASDSHDWDTESLFLEFFSSLISRYDPVVNRVSSLSKEHKAVREVRHFLQSNLSEHITLNMLARIAGLHVCYLVRLFQKDLGIAPYRYLTKLRITKASELLSKGMEPAHVAHAVGLCDQSHLTRLFKRSTGMTPGSYMRKRHI